MESVVYIYKLFVGLSRFSPSENTSDLFTHLHCYSPLKTPDHPVLMSDWSCTSEGLHHHSRGPSVSPLQQTFTNGAMATRLPKLQSLKDALLGDFPGIQSCLDLWKADRGCSQGLTVLPCQKNTQPEIQTLMNKNWFYSGYSGFMQRLYSYWVSVSFGHLIFLSEQAIKKHKRSGYLIFVLKYKN